MVAKRTTTAKSAAAERTPAGTSTTGEPSAESTAAGSGGPAPGAKKASAKKEPRKKTAAKKAAAAKEPGTAEKEPSGEARAKRAPAKKAAAKKARARKAPAKKAATRRTGPAKAAEPVASAQGAASAAGSARAPAKKAQARGAGADQAAAAAKDAADAAKKTGAKTVAAKKTAGGRESRAGDRAGTATAVQPAGVAAPVAPEDLPVRPGEDPWTAAEVEEARTGLQDEAVRLAAEISTSGEALAGLMRDSADGAGDDEADTGTKNITREHEMALAANAREMLEQTERALQRLVAGTYGRCEVCGRPIGKARMQAFPRATLCVEDKQKQERRG
jgi:RNA polymerase-binding transcription factor DksA